MAGRTRLFQRAGSPLIQGHSRHERSFWSEWLLACSIAIPGVYVLQAIMTLLDPARGALDSAANMMKWLAQPALALGAALAASAGGVLLARRLGWSKAWLTGGAIGIVVGALVFLYV